MSEQARSVRQRELFAASAAIGQRRREGAGQADPPAEAGDLFLLEATVDFPVEWALLERRDAAGPFLAVLGDSHPFVGSRDLQVETSTSTLNLRGESGVWLDPSSLKAELRVGRLAPAALERARRKVGEVSQQGFAPDPFLEDVDLSPEYEEWMRDVVRPARAAAGSAAVVLPFKAAEPHRRPRFPWLAAAAIFLLAALGLTVQALRQRQEIEGLAARAGSAETALLAERARREEEARARASTLKGWEEQTRALQARLAALEGRLGAVEQPLLNLPVAILQPAEAMRGTAPKFYRLPPTAPFLVVVLKFRETDPFPAYRVTLTQPGNAKPAWSTDGLARSPEGVQLTLPRRLVSPGKYRLSLSGLQAGRAQPVGDYELTVAP